jgi:hypothetical protein
MSGISRFQTTTRKPAILTDMFHDFPYSFLEIPEIPEIPSNQATTTSFHIFFNQGMKNLIIQLNTEWITDIVIK